MFGPDRQTSRYDSLRNSRRSLRWVAILVRYGLMSVGFTMFLGQAQSLLSDTQFTWAERQILGVMGLSYLVGFGLAAWVSGKLIATGAEFIDVVVDQAEAANRTADLIETQAIPTLGRIALALEKLAIPTQATTPVSAPATPSPTPDDDRARAFAVARRAILDGRWTQAEKLVGIFVRNYPGPEAGGLLTELEAARHRAIEDLKARLEAAKVAEEAEKVVDLRDALTQHLRGTDLDTLDRKLVRWLVSVIQNRVRAGSITPELAALASRVADSFGDTPEAITLRKSIPNLRRSAGLCPGADELIKAMPRFALDAGCPPQGRDPHLPPCPTPNLEPHRKEAAMSLRLRCRSCQTAFVTTKDQVGQTVSCPKCDAKQVVPIPKPTSETVEEGPALQRMKPPGAGPVAKEKESIFLAKDKKTPKGATAGSRKGLWIGVFALMTLGVGLLIAWPAIMKWFNPRPTGVVEGVAYDYLKALQDGDEKAVQKIGIIEEPPAIRSFDNLKRDKTRNARIDGKFTAIGNLHKQIKKTFVYDPKSGRFTLKDPLGTAAETLDELHAAKAKMEKDGTYTKMSSGDPEEAMQAAIDFGGVFEKLSKGILSPRKLIPSYKMLVQNSKPPLTGNELALALDYATHRESWDRLLKRPFPDIESKGLYQYDRAEVLAEVRDKLGSSGDPPYKLRLKLVRFQMDGIETGWRVVSARKVVPGMPDDVEDEEGPDPEPQAPTQPSKPSPGELPTSPGLNLDGLPVDLPK